MKLWQWRMDDRGGATMFAAGLMLLLTLALSSGLVALEVIGVHRAAKNAADLAALAGAGRVQEGESACDAANEVAARNHATLTSCAQRGQEVLVRVMVASTSMLPVEMSARARAGPVTPGATD